MNQPNGSPGAGDDRVVARILVYSDDSGTRAQVLQALGAIPGQRTAARLHPDLPDLECVEVATAAMVLREFDTGTVDLAILDGEAAPVGGLGLAKQIRDEYEPCPPLLVLIARSADRWLADWSRADASAPLPVDPLGLPREVTALLRRRARRQ